MKNIKYSLLLTSVLAVSTSNATVKQTMSNSWNNVKNHKLAYGLSTTGLALSGIIAYDIIKNGDKSRTIRALKATGLFASEQGQRLLKVIKTHPWIATSIIATTGLGSLVLGDLFLRENKNDAYTKKGYDKVIALFSKKASE